VAAVEKGVFVHGFGWLLLLTSDSAPQNWRLLIFWLQVLVVRKEQGKLRTSNVEGEPRMDTNMHEWES
jgi:hypothetical protein